MLPRHLYLRFLISVSWCTRNCFLWQYGHITQPPSVRNLDVIVNCLSIIELRCLLTPRLLASLEFSLLQGGLKQQLGVWKCIVSMEEENPNESYLSVLTSLGYGGSSAAHRRKEIVTRLNQSKKVKGYVRYRSVKCHKAKSKSRSGSRGTLVVAHNIMTCQRLSIPNLENAP